MILNGEFDTYVQRILEICSSQVLPVKQIKSLVWEININVLVNKTKLDLV